MTWYLALQGTSHMTHQPSVYELQESADVDKIAQELVSSATLDRVVEPLVRRNPRHVHIGVRRPLARDWRQIGDVHSSSLIRSETTIIPRRRFA